MFNPNVQSSIRTVAIVALCLLLVGRADAGSLRRSTTETQMCKSIIAVGSTYLPDPDKQLLDIDGNVVYVDGTEDDGGDDVISYEDADANTKPSYDETFVCELHDGNTLPIESTDEQLRELQDLLNKGKLISAETAIEVTSSAPLNGTAALTAEQLQTSVSLPSGRIRLVQKREEDPIVEDTDRRSRRLNRFEGVKKTLIVRVKDKKGRQVSGDHKTLSDKWFGTYG